MKRKEILEMVDHTLLKQTATFEDIKLLCDEAVKYNTASVCIAPCFVKRAQEYLEGKIPICTVIGFPNGYNTTAIKAGETKEAIDNGADEIDMVINITDLKSKNYEAVLSEIKTLKSVCGDKVLKVIIETCLLSDEEKIKMCDIVSDSGADFIKTSTGFSSAGATLDDVKLFSKHIKNGVKIKAAGGISDFDDAQKFITSGAKRLGTSRLVKIMEKCDNK